LEALYVMAKADTERSVALTRKFMDQVDERCPGLVRDFVIGFLGDRAAIARVEGGNLPTDTAVLTSRDVLMLALQDDSDAGIDLAVEFFCEVDRLCPGLINQFTHDELGSLTPPAPDEPTIPNRPRVKP
jgi:hypothetical protein